MQFVYFILRYSTIIHSSVAQQLIWWPQQKHRLTKHSSRGSWYNMLTIVKLPDVFSNICSTNASMTLDWHVISKSKYNLSHITISRITNVFVIYFKTTQAMHRNFSCITFWICCASSRVGDKTRAWVSRSCVSIICSTDIEKVAVLPVPDCALEQKQLTLIFLHEVCNRNGSLFSNTNVYTNTHWQANI